MRLLIFFIFISCGLSYAKSLDLSKVDKSQRELLSKKYPQLISYPMNQSKVDKVLKALYRSGEYERLEAHIKNDKYIIFTEKVPRINSIEISTDYNRSFIEESIGFVKNQKFNKSQLNSKIDKLKLEFNKKAYFRPKIHYRLLKDLQGNTKLYLFVQKGSITKIGKLAIHSENKDFNEDFSDHLSSFKGKALSQNRISELETSIKEYLQSNDYYGSSFSDPIINFNPDKEEANITINIQNPFQFRFKFIGNHRYNTSYLIKKLNIANSPPSKLNPSSELAQRLKDYYLSSGFANIVIKYTEVIDPKKHQLNITFRINEGSIVDISAVQFEGRLSQSSEYYQEWVFQNGEEKIQDKIYNKEKLESSIQKLVLFLKNKGYLQAKLISIRITPNKDRSEILVTVILDEGPLTVLEKIEFIGAHSFQPQQLKTAINLQEESPLKLDQLEKARLALQNFYFSASYLEMKFLTPMEESIFYNEDKTKASLVFKIQEGTKIKVASIEIQGAEKTKEQVILNSLYFEVGDYLNPESIQESVASLQRLGLFQSILIRPQESSTENRKILISLQERNPGVFTFGIGMTNEERLTIRGYTGLGYRNLGGNARTIASRVELQYKVFKDDFVENKITADYTEPFLFNTKNRGRINLSHSQELLDTQGLISNELNFYISRNFNRNFRLDWKFWGLEETEKFELDQRSVRENFRIATLGPLLEWDYRDNVFLPKSGTLTRFKAEYSDPEIGSSDTVNYIRTNISFNHYIPLTSNRRHILAYSLRSGYLKNLGGEDTAVPQEKMFFLGGRSTIRGFPYFSIPNTNQIRNSGESFASLETESSFYLVKLEYRFPIYDIIGGALFYDGGSVDILDKEIEPLYREAAGISLQIETPIGAFNIGYGKKLNRQNGESDGEWFLSIGDF